MRKLAAILAFGGLMLGLAWVLERGSTAFGAMPELISIRDFYANSEATWQYKISPDGKRLGWITAHDGRPAIFTRKLGEDEVRVISADRGILDYWWVQDSRRIFFSWDRYGDENWHLLMADSDAPDSPYVDLTPYPGVRARVHQVFPDDPSTILVKLNRRDPSTFDLYRLDIDTREETLVDQNPGDVVDWVTSPEGVFLARRRDKGPDGWEMQVRTAEGAWVRSFGWPPGDTLEVVGRPLNAESVYARSNRGRDRVALVKIDLGTGAETLVLEHPEVDLDGVWADYESYELQAAWSSPDYQQVHAFDEQAGRDLAKLQGPERANVWITGAARHGRLWSATVSSPTEGLAFVLYDRDTGERTLLDTSDISRHKAGFAPMEPISFPARDGLELRGYLTLPRGGPQRNLPLVLKVHPGPWSRARWGFDLETQLLANRGYAVLEVNYRGSAGYGRRFMEAGFGEIGRKMQDDLVDAVAWATGRGIADPARVAIYGWDYGGYAALEGLMAPSQIFAAAVSAAAPLDWASTLEALPPYLHQERALHYTYLGDPSNPTDRERMRERSPLYRAEQVGRPLLLVQGGNDPRGIEDQAERFVTELRKHESAVEYLFLPDEGRWIQNWQNNVRFYRSLENFLGAHLGGRVSPIHQVERYLGLH